MDIVYERGGRMHISLDEADLGSLATRGFCMTRNGLVGHDTKTWIRHDTFAQEPTASIDGDSDLNIDISPEQQMPFVVTRNAISARNGDQGMVDWFFHGGAGIFVE